MLKFSNFKFYKLKKNYASTNASLAIHIKYLFCAKNNRPVPNVENINIDTGKILTSTAPICHWKYWHQQQFVNVFPIKFIWGKTVLMYPMYPIPKILWKTLPREQRWQYTYVKWRFCHIRNVTHNFLTKGTTLVIKNEHIWNINEFHTWNISHCHICK
jgi:hypothetical protein